MALRSPKAAMVELAKPPRYEAPAEHDRVERLPGHADAFVPFERRKVDSRGPQGVYLVFAHLKLAPGSAERRQGPPIKDKMHRCGRRPAPMDGRTGGPTIPLPEPRMGPPVEQADQPLRLNAMLACPP
jgi:hypothetical protein